MKPFVQLVQHLGDVYFPKLGEAPFWQYVFFSRCLQQIQEHLSTEAMAKQLLDFWTPHPAAPVLLPRPCCFVTTPQAAAPLLPKFRMMASHRKSAGLHPKMRPNATQSTPVLLGRKRSTRISCGSRPPPSDASFGSRTRAGSTRPERPRGEWRAPTSRRSAVGTGIRSPA